MSSIHYKFRATIHLNTVKFEGLNILGSDLKREIYAKENIKPEAFDLILQNSHTKRTYGNEELVPRNSTIIVQRVPRDGAEKLPKIPSGNGGLITRGGAAAAGSSDVVVNADVVGHLDEAQRVKMSESELLEHMRGVSTSKYHSSNYQKRTKGIMTGAPPPNYICNRCNQSGHWYNNCPMMNTKRTAGLHMQELMEVSADDPNAMFHQSSGKYVIPIMHWKARHQKKAVEDGSSSPAEKPVPPSLICKICDEILKDAVITTCCGVSFCHDCVTTALMATDDRECPNSSCGQSGLSVVNSIIPNKSVRDGVAHFLSNTSARGVSSTPASPNINTEEPPVVQKVRIGLNPTTVQKTPAQQQQLGDVYAQLGKVLSSVPQTDSGSTSTVTLLEPSDKARPSVSPPAQAAPNSIHQNTTSSQLPIPQQTNILPQQTQTMGSVIPPQQFNPQQPPPIIMSQPPPMMSMNSSVPQMSQMTTSQSYMQNMHMQVVPPGTEKVATFLDLQQLAPPGTVNTSIPHMGLAAIPGLQQLIQRPLMQAPLYSNNQIGGGFAVPSLNIYGHGQQQPVHDEWSTYLAKKDQERNRDRDRDRRRYPPARDIRDHRFRGNPRVRIRDERDGRNRDRDRRRRRDESSDSIDSDSGHENHRKRGTDKGKNKDRISRKEKDDRRISKRRVDKSEKKEKHLREEKVDKKRVEKREKSVEKTDKQVDFERDSCDRKRTLPDPESSSDTEQIEIKKRRDEERPESRDDEDLIDAQLREAEEYQKAGFEMHDDSHDSGDRELYSPPTPEQTDDKENDDKVKNQSDAERAHSVDAEATPIENPSQWRAVVSQSAQLGEASDDADTHIKTLEEVDETSKWEKSSVEMESADEENVKDVSEPAETAPVERMMSSDTVVEVEVKNKIISHELTKTVDDSISHSDDESGKKKKKKKKHKKEKKHKKDKSRDKDNISDDESHSKKKNKKEKHVESGRDAAKRKEQEKPDQQKEKRTLVDSKSRDHPSTSRKEDKAEKLKENDEKHRDDRDRRVERDRHSDKDNRRNEKDRPREKDRDRVPDKDRRYRDTNDRAHHDSKDVRKDTKGEERRKEGDRMEKGKERGDRTEKRREERHKSPARRVMNEMDAIMERRKEEQSRKSATSEKRDKERSDTHRKSEKEKGSSRHEHESLKKSESLESTEAEKTSASVPVDSRIPLPGEKTEIKKIEQRKESTKSHVDDLTRAARRTGVTSQSNKDAVQEKVPDTEKSRPEKVQISVSSSSLFEEPKRNKRTPIVFNLPKK